MFRKIKYLANRVWAFYADGFRNMSASNRKLWLIILIKLVIIFVVLNFFFFPDYLDTRFHTDKGKSNHVMEQLINN